MHYIRIETLLYYSQCLLSVKQIIVVALVIYDGEHDRYIAKNVNRFLCTGLSITILAQNLIC